jgi:leader peptidase (prepilin peptidase) / N-methyltransferase
MLLTALLIGLCFGSFANVLIYRLPLGKSIAFPSSFCPNCKNPIKWYDNIPVLSFFILKGKCRHCGLKISPKYPIIEISSSVLFGILWNSQTNIFTYYLTALFFFCLFIMSFIDCEHQIIPDSLAITILIIALILHPTNFLAGIFSFLLFYLIAILAEKIFKKEALGGGDIKLATGLGIFLGITKFLTAFFIASLASTIVGIYLIIIHKKQTDHYIPYGPFLALGTLITYLGTN